MGKQSSLGPIDPQFGVIAAANLLAEVQRAHREILANPNTAFFWNPILSQITPSFIERCEQAIKDAGNFLDLTLRQNMFSNVPENAIEDRVKRVTDIFGNTEGKAHNTHIQYSRCVDAGLVIEKLEDDQTFQDLVLTIHHCYIHTLMNTPATKVIENHNGKAIVKQLQFSTVVPQSVQIQQLPMTIQPAPAAEPVEDA
jgi:hypothetical protein